MRRPNRVVLGLLMALVADFAIAAWSGSGKIQKIYFSSSRILIVHDLMADPDGCGRLDYFILPQTNNALLKEMYSTILAAHIAGKPVNFIIQGCDQGFPKIVDFYTVN